jgi:CheY-like chemotaxis protein
MTAAREEKAAVLVVDADAALAGLLEEWLGALGCSVSFEGGRRAADGFDLIVVDVPFPRQCGRDVLKRVASEHPGVPVLALSSSLFAGMASSAGVARALGVAGALPKPVAREKLVAAVRGLLDAGK